MKKYLIILQHSPYANSQALESLEFALAIAAFDQEVTLLFKGAGALQALHNQQPQGIAAKNFTKAYAGLNLFGISSVYIDAESVVNLDLSNLIMQPQSLTATEISSLIAAHDIILDL